MFASHTNKTNTDHVLWLIPRFYWCVAFNYLRICAHKDLFIVPAYYGHTEKEIVFFSISLYFHLSFDSVDVQYLISVPNDHASVFVVLYAWCFCQFFFAQFHICQFVSTASLINRIKRLSVVLLKERATRYYAVFSIPLWHSIHLVLVIVWLSWQRQRVSSSYVNK